MIKSLPFNAGDLCTILGQEAKITHVSQPKKKKKQNIKQKQYCKKFNKDFKKLFVLKKSFKMIIRKTIQ